MALATLNWGTSAETTSTLGLDRLDYRTPPTQYHVSGDQISQMKNLLIYMSQYMGGGNRLRILPTASNQFAVTESGLQITSTLAQYVILGAGAWNLRGTKAQTVVAAATTAIDLSLGNIVTVTMGTNITAWSITSPVVGDPILITFVQDGVGTRTLAGAAATIKFLATTYLGATAGAPTLTVTAAKRDTLFFVYDGTDFVELARNYNK
jgi:hypothetical protein